MFDDLGLVRHSMPVLLPHLIMARSSQNNRSFFSRKAREFRKGVRNSYRQYPRRKWNPSSWRFDAFVAATTVPTPCKTSRHRSRRIKGQPNKKGIKTMTNETQTQNKPAYTERYGNVKGVIWRNIGQEDSRPYYSVNYVRSYTDDAGNWKDTHSFSETDNLKLGIVNDLVSKRIIALKAQDRQELSSEGGQ